MSSAPPALVAFVEVLAALGPHVIMFTMLLASQTYSKRRSPTNLCSPLVAVGKRFPSNRLVSSFQERSLHVSRPSRSSYVLCAESTAPSQPVQGSSEPRLTSRRPLPVLHATEPHAPDAVVPRTQQLISPAPSVSTGKPSPKSRWNMAGNGVPAAVG